MTRKKKSGIEEILTGVIVLGALFYTFVIQPFILWIQQNQVLAIIMGIVFLLALGLGIKLYLNHRKTKNEEIEIERKKELSILHKKDLEKLSEEEKEIMINKWYKEEIGNETIFDKIAKLFTKVDKNEKTSKKVRIPIPKDTKIFVMNRARNKCQLCGVEYTLKYHHIDKNPANNSPNNIIVLCPTHHDMADKNAYTKEQLYAKRDQYFVKTDSGTFKKSN